ncbi:MAG: hypothetical protein ACI4IW_06005 [Oscillospiraceae bacterium]
MKFDIISTSDSIFLEGFFVAYRTRENRVETFVATLVFVMIIAALVVAVAVFGIFKKEPASEYDWITSDPAVTEGMLDGSFYDGERNPQGVLSYKVAEEITVGSDGRGDFKIENSGKNTCLMKVKIVIGSETIYETGYIKPNQHIYSDVLDKLPQPGTYSAEVIFEGFDPTTETSIGSTKTEITVTVTE